MPFYSMRKPEFNFNNHDNTNRIQITTSNQTRTNVSNFNYSQIGPRFSNNSNNNDYNNQTRSVEINSNNNAYGNNNIVRINNLQEPAFGIYIPLSLSLSSLLVGAAVGLASFIGYEILKVINF